MIKTINDDVRLQALIDGKKVVINEASIRHDHKLNDEEGYSCLSNAVIFEELARIGSTIASAIIFLANNQKLNFSKYNLANLKKNLEAGVPFYMFPRFLQVFMNHQLGDMSHHKVIPLFGTMMVQALKEVGEKIANIDADVEVNQENVYNLDMAHEETVLSMQDVDVQSERIDADVKEVAKEFVEVMEIAKIIIDEVSTTGGELNDANEGTLLLLNQDNTEKQMLEEQQEADELKKNLDIVLDDEDDVFMNVTHLSSKPPTIMDYKIYEEGKKEHFKIFRANGNHQMYLAFSIILKNFDREDLEVLWNIVKDRFKESQPKEVFDVFLWHTLKVKAKLKTLEIIMDNIKFRGGLLGKQPARATTPTEPIDIERTEAKQLKIVLKKSRQETHISQQRGSGTDEGTGSRPGVPDVPSDDSEEELSWNSSDDEDVDEQTKGREESEGDKTDESDDDNDETIKAGSDKDDDDNDDEEELTKNDDEDTESGKGGDEVSESERESDEKETRQEEEESFDPIPRTPEGSKDEGSDEEDQELRLSEEARIQEEEDADELYRDVNINQGRIMTPSTIATITTSSDAPIPPTIIPSIILKNLITFNSAFRFDERLSHDFVEEALESKQTGEAAIKLFSEMEYRFVEREPCINSTMFLL
nr:hypothetical protein [Tanacetum cinerariifolium]